MRALDRVDIAHVLNSGEGEQTISRNPIKFQNMFFCTFERSSLALLDMPPLPPSVDWVPLSGTYIGVHWADRPCNQRAVAYYINAQGFKGNVCWSVARESDQYSRATLYVCTKIDSSIIVKKWPLFKKSKSF